MLLMRNEVISDMQNIIRLTDLELKIVKAALGRCNSSDIKYVLEYEGEEVSLLELNDYAMYEAIKDFIKNNIVKEDK
jgi:hypothetical protein